MEALVNGGRRRGECESLLSSSAASTSTISRPFLLHVQDTSLAAQPDSPEGQVRSIRRRRHRMKQPNVPREHENADDEKRTSSSAAHPDERQIKLDTDRSFVIYPVGEKFPISRPSTVHSTVTRRKRG